MAAFEFRHTLIGSQKGTCLAFLPSFPSFAPSPCMAHGSLLYHHHEGTRREHLEASLVLR